MAVTVLLSTTVLLVLAGTSGAAHARVSSKYTNPLNLKKLRGTTLTVTTYGGVWTTDEEKYFYKPFTAATGIKVTTIVNGENPGIPLILQEKSHDVTIGIVEGQNVLLHNDGYTQTFPSWLYKDMQEAFTPGYYSSYTIGWGNTADLIVCNPAVMKKCPLTPKEFFNVKAYPGPRAIDDNPATAIPFAEEAAGVPGNKLTPINWSLAESELNKIKPDITVWPSSGAQMQQIFIDKEVGAGLIWNGRAYVVKADNIHNLVLSWAGSLIGAPEGQIIPAQASTTEKDDAYEFIYWMTQHPKLQAEWTEAIDYPTPTKQLKSLIPSAVAAALPTDQKQITVLNENYMESSSVTTKLNNFWTTFLP